MTTLTLKAGGATFPHPTERLRVGGAVADRRGTRLRPR